jgi:TonB family protein
VQAYYLTLVKFKIEEAWNLLAVGVPPEASVVVRLRILRSGSVKDIEVVTSSGSSSVDNVAVRAIRQSQPLPPFPNLLSEPSLEVMLRFVMDSARRGA